MQFFHDFIISSVTIRTRALTQYNSLHRVRAIIKLGFIMFLLQYDDISLLLYFQINVALTSDL